MVSKVEASPVHQCAGHEEQYDDCPEQKRHQFVNLRQEMARKLFFPDLEICGKL